MANEIRTAKLPEITLRKGWLERDIARAQKRMAELTDWRPISTAPRDGTEVVVRNDRGEFWIDRYEVIQPGAEEGWPISVVQWRSVQP